MRKERILLFIGWWLPLVGGCVSSGGLNDLSLFSVEHAPLQTSDQLKIEFTTAVNLSRLMDEDHYLLASEGYFCDHPRDYVLLMGRTLYYDDRQVSANIPISAQTPGRKFLYSTYLNINRDVGASTPQELRYDLRRHPEDVCFYIAGGNGAYFGLKSNVVIIPKHEIASALRQSRPGLINP